jgi:hypothetical protein
VAERGMRWLLMNLWNVLVLVLVVVLILFLLTRL